MRADLTIELLLGGDGTVAARGDMAKAPYWCRWDGSVLWIVGSAATPVGDDDVSLRLVVDEGVHAEVRTVAATIVYAASGAGTRLTTHLEVADEATLIWRPEPVIVTSRARHRATMVADVAPEGRLVADEVVVLGRSGEAAGTYASISELRRDGETISLSGFDTSTPGWSGPGGIDGAKVVGTRILVAPHDPASDRCRPPAVDRATVVLRPEGGGAIATTVASDPVGARADLERFLPDVGTMAIDDAGAA